MGFNRDFKRDGSIYLWNAELKIEFITPEKGRGVDSSIKIKKQFFPKFDAVWEELNQKFSLE